MTAVVVIWIGEAKTALYLAVSKKYTTYMARSGKRGLELAQHRAARLIIVDADSLHTSGQRITQQLRAALPSVPCLLIVPPPASASGIAVSAPNVSTRKFLTQISRLLSASTPQVIASGGFLLDTAQRILTVGDQQITLNPKQCKLLEVFFTHPNEIIARATLMKQVWETDYLGDTRTLDVHIRWVRTKLQGADGRYGHTLTTVRGVGYRLDITHKKGG